MRYYLNGRAKGYIAYVWDDIGKAKVKSRSLQEAKRNAITLLDKRKSAKDVEILRYWDENDESEWKLSGYVFRDGRRYRFLSVINDETYYIDKNGKKI